MVLETSELKIKNLAGILGAMQGLAWTAMSLMCLILHNSEPVTKTPGTYMESIGLSIYKIFLSSDEESFSGQTLTGDIFEVFMCIHFFLNVCWMGLSVNMFLKNTYPAITYWSFCTFYVCLCDALTAIMLGADYNRCLRFMRERIIFNPEDLIVLEAVCVRAILPMVVIAAKGFTLWFLNVSIASFLLRIRRKIE